MGLLDDSAIYTTFHILAIIVEIANLFWIYVAWKYSTQMMAKFKVFIMKMATSDLIFSLVLTWLFQPNLMMPLPCATVYGPLRYIGPTAGKIALILVVIAGLSTLISVNDCCISRFMIIYGHENMLHHFSGCRGLIFFFVLYGSSGGIITFLILYYSCSYEELHVYAVRNGKERFFEQIKPEYPLVAFDADNSEAIPAVVFIGGALVFIECLNISLSAAVQHRLNQTRKTISSKTYKMQRSFTYFLIVQATVPFASITSPVIFYAVSFVAHWTDYIESDVTQFMAITTFLLYPLINCITCFVLIKPYKMFFIRQISKVIKCVAPSLIKMESSSVVVSTITAR